MTRLNWDGVGERLYDKGVEKGVLYPKDGPGVAWSGLISVTELSSSEIQALYIDGVQVRNDQSVNSFAAKIEAYTYPFELETALDTTRRRQTFNLCYRTETTSDLGEVRYQLHLVYNSILVPTNKDYTTENTSSNILTFSWNLSTSSVIIPEFGSSAHLVIDSSEAYPWIVTILEDILYGSDENDPRFPSVSELYEIFDDQAILRITDHGDGTWTAEGPDEAIKVFAGDSGWVVNRRNLFKDPLARTTATASWGSTDGLPTTVTDGDGTTWARFTKVTTGNTRLADIKIGTTLLASTAYRFTFMIRSSRTRTLVTSVRANVAATTGQVQPGPVNVLEGIPTLVDIVVTTPPNTPTTGAGITLTHNSTVLDSTLDVSLVNVELASTANGTVISGDSPDGDVYRYGWEGAINASPSIYEVQGGYFEITWPSVVYIDSETYKISSL